MSDHSTRPTRPQDATVTDRHRRLAEQHARVEECPWDYDGPFIGVAAGTLIGAIAGYGYPADAGNPTLGLVIAAAVVAVGVAGWFRVAHNQRRCTQRHWARALAYLEGLRGKELDRALARWCAEHPGTSIIDVAQSASSMAHSVGADRAHQLMVRAQQTNDYGLFGRLCNASIETRPNGWSRNQRRADCYTEVVDAILASREPVGSVVDIERMLDAADARRVDMAL